MPTRVLRYLAERDRYALNGYPLTNNDYVRQDRLNTFGDGRVFEVSYASHSKGAKPQSFRLLGFPRRTV